MCRVRVTEREIYDDRFLEYVLPGYLDAIHEHTSSVTVKHLSSRTVAEIPVPRPTLEEQQQIVQTIEEQFSRIDSAVGSLQRALSRASALRRTILHNAFDPRSRADGLF